MTEWDIDNVVWNTLLTRFPLPDPVKTEGYRHKFSRCHVVWSKHEYLVINWFFHRDIPWADYRSLRCGSLRLSFESHKIFHAHIWSVNERTLSALRQQNLKTSIIIMVCVLTDHRVPISLPTTFHLDLIQMYGWFRERRLLCITSYFELETIKLECNMANIRGSRLHHCTCIERMTKIPKGSSIVKWTLDVWRKICIHGADRLDNALNSRLLFCVPHWIMYRSFVRWVSSPSYTKLPRWSHHNRFSSFINDVFAESCDRFAVKWWRVYESLHKSHGQIPAWPRTGRMIVGQVSDTDFDSLELALVSADRLSELPSHSSSHAGGNIASCFTVRMGRV
jgi:hypothetical protein